MLYLNQRFISPFEVTFPEEKAVPYVSELNTIGHRILEEDRRSQEIPSSIFERLDAVISEIESKITVDNVASIDDAKYVLERIEQLITKMNFICSIPYFLVHSFGEGLEPRELDQRIIWAPENEIRRKHILQHQQELFSHVDCDISCILYLSIAEALALPLRMVEVPRHNFIRWRFTDDRYLNWDTNYGFNKYTNDEYVSYHGVTQDLILNDTYLADLSTENVEGYFNFIRGITFQRKNEYNNAVDEYRIAISKYPQSPLSYNNIAWLFVSIRTVQKIVTKEEALKLALKTTEIHRTDNNLDTLACVYAEHGDFESAIRIETEAYRLNPSPSYRQMIEAFREGKTWLDVHSE